MNTDNILAIMPGRLDHFLAASSVLQDYCVQLHKQVGMKQRNANFWFTVEVVDDSYLFFAPIFPRMNLVVRNGDGQYNRKDWSCVLDFNDVRRAWRIAEIPKKHITEAWGIMVGASPGALPGLGPMMPQGMAGVADVLIDSEVPVGEAMYRYFSTNYPQAKVAIRDLNNLRPSTLFSLLSEAKVFVGMRGGASYLALTMGLPTLELYPDDEPIWWMGKPQSDTYRIFYGGKFPKETIWAILEEVWKNAVGYQDEDDSLLQQLSITQSLATGAV